MVTMSAIWDRTAEVLRGRGSMLAGIAGLFVFLPTIAQNAFATFGGRSPAVVLAGGLVALLAGLGAIWGNLSLVAAASDPAVGRGAAISIGGRRLLPAIGISILLVLAVAVALMPAAMLFGAGLLDATSLRAGAVPRLAATPSPGLALAALVYAIAFAAVAIWVSARLALFWPVLVNERRGLGSIARSFALTRGLTSRIIGVVLLFLVLLLVALGAAQLVTALVARLLLGADAVATAQFIGAVAGAAVTAGGTVVSATFVAQLYRVVSGREAAHTFA